MTARTGVLARLLIIDPQSASQCISGFVECVFRYFFFSSSYEYDDHYFVPPFGLNFRRGKSEVLVMHH